MENDFDKRLRLAYRGDHTKTDRDRETETETERGREREDNHNNVTLAKQSKLC